MEKKQPLSSSGSWLMAAYDSARQNNKIQLHIATVSNIDDPKSGLFENVEFIVIPGGSIFQYDINSIDNKLYWEQVKKTIAPELVIIWGTESRFSYLAMTIFKGTPMLIYVQGVMKSITDHYIDGIPHHVHFSTIRDFIDVVNPHKQYKDFKRQVALEKQMFLMADGVIIENDWCESQCLAINRNLIVHYNKLPIRAPFYNTKWLNNNVHSHTIFTNAGGLPYKGHHVLFQALSLVKKVYPDVVLYIPGGNYLDETNSIVHRTGYYNWLHKIYNDDKLCDNIKFVGVLDANAMADYLSICNVFVMPSMVENHSSSLIEALVVGCPSISSAVGGAASIIRHGTNGYLYNSSEYESLAGYIIKLFDNPAICNEFSMNSVFVRNSRLEDFGSAMNDIYDNYHNID